MGRNYYPTFNSDFAKYILKPLQMKLSNPDKASTFEDDHVMINSKQMWVQLWAD